MKTIEINIDINSAMSICLRSGLKVYPVVVGSKFVIEVDNNGEIIKGNKLYSGKEVARVQSKVYKYYAKKILKENASKSKENK